MIWIGIDTGTHTGFAVWDDEQRKLLEVATLPIHKALTKVQEYKSQGHKLFVIFEDARQRKWYGHYNREKHRWVESANGDAQLLQGAGSIKRDCCIWEDFLTDEHIPFRAQPPIKGGTKVNNEFFRRVTKWQGRTSDHARDAVMLVFGK